MRRDGVVMGVLVLQYTVKLSRLWILIGESPLWPRLQWRWLYSHIDKIGGSYLEMWNKFQLIRAPAKIKLVFSSVDHMNIVLLRPLTQTPPPLLSYHFVASPKFQLYKYSLCISASVASCVSELQYIHNTMLGNALGYIVVYRGKQVFTTRFSFGWFGRWVLISTQCLLWTTQEEHKHSRRDSRGVSTWVRKEIELHRREPGGRYAGDFALFDRRVSDSAAARCGPQQGGAEQDAKRQHFGDKGVATLRVQ